MGITSSIMYCGDITSLAHYIIYLTITNLEYFKSAKRSQAEIGKIVVKQRGICVQKEKATLAIGRHKFYECILGNF